ncbi:MAG: DegV family protein [Firmicutes bacterium]|nr:DegV family protein [Lachnospiraceae bacterium]MDD6067087.1 DegV family protein [Bacillota bacterium]MDY2819566.1 DegV family protein [Hominisplanchenecus sp.]
MSFRVVIDSCGELTEEMKNSGNFVSAPLTLQVDEHVVIDDDSFDQAEFLKMVAESPNCPKSSCPSPEVYRDAYDCGADHVYAVTLSARLSGSYNSAELGKNLYLEDHPDAKVHVFNSCSASIGQTLIGLKIQELEEQGLSFEEVVEQTESYIRSQNTWFVLENLETLRKNGRLGTVKALVATALKIKPLMGATPEGTIIQLDQARGMNKALVKMVDVIAEKIEDAEKKTLAISHCNCPKRAQMVKDALMKRVPFRDVVILDTRGVSTMYANDGGIIVVA